MNKKESKLVSGAGFTTIYCTDTVKIELSIQKMYLRMTVFYDGSKERERLYERVSDGMKRKEIENLSENWYLYGRGSTREYYVLRQLYMHDKGTGYFKIIKKEKAELSVWPWSTKVRASSEADWIYYARRGQ